MTERPSDLLILALRPGDTLIVHLPSKPDESYAEDVKAAIRRQLSFDVPIIVVGPGVTFEVARPVSEPNAQPQPIGKPCAIAPAVGGLVYDRNDVRCWHEGGLWHDLSVAPQPQPDGEPEPAAQWNWDGPPNG